MTITRPRALKDRGKIITLGVQAAVTDRAGRVLLVRHGYRPGWHFPGGGVERAETLGTALARELEEEAGLVLERPAELFGIYAHFDAYPGDHIVLFTAAHWRRVRIPQPNREIAETGFYALDRLPDGTTASTRLRLAELFSGARRAKNW